MRRHRVGVLAAATVLLAVVGGLAATQWKAREATKEAARAERVTEFLVSLFREADPEQARGREVTARELLQRGERQLDSVLVREPDTRARLLGVLGVIHTQLGLYGRADDSLLARAVALTRESRGEESPELAERLSDWAEALAAEAKYAAADSAARQALAIRRRRFGPNDSSVAANLQTLGGIARRRGLTDTAVAFHRQALAIDRRLYGDGHLVVAEVLDDLGVALDELGDLPAADSAAAAALAIKRRWLDPDHPSVITSLHNLGLVREDQGDYQESERLKREVVERFRRLYPDGHPDLAVALKMLGSRLRHRQRYEEAESLFIQARAMQQALLGPAHPAVFFTLNDLAVLRYEKENLGAAERDMRAVFEHLRQTLGEDNPNTLQTLTNVGAILRDEGNYRGAEPLLRRALASRRRVLGDDHPEVAQSWGVLGELLYLEGDLAGAERAYRQGPRDEPQEGYPTGPRHHGLAPARPGAGADCRRAGPAKAEPLLREALAIRTKKLEPGDRLTAKTRAEAGRVPRATGPTGGGRSADAGGLPCGERHRTTGLRGRTPPTLRGCWPSSTRLGAVPAKRLATGIWLALAHGRGGGCYRTRAGWRDRQTSMRWLRSPCATSWWTTPRYSAGQEWWRSAAGDPR